MFKKIIHNNSGFTVLELMTVTAIIAILLVMVVTNFHGFDSKSSLDLEADKISSILRQAQIWALTGQTVAGQRYNFGIHFEECQSGSCNYILFYDDNDNKLYDVGEVYEQGNYNIFKEIYIAENNLKIGSSSVNELDVIFEAPLGDVYFNGLTNESEAQIILKHNKTSIQKIISVNRTSGRINIQ